MSLTYAEHRAQRMWLAHDYDGWDMPPYPWHDHEPVNIGRVVMFPVGNSHRLIAPGFYPNPVHRGITDHFRAREKAQNRTLLK